MKKAIMVTDPVGNKVWIAMDMIHQCKLNKTYDELNKVVTAPAILLQEGTSCLYYYRALSWEITVLLEVRNENGFWKAITYKINPNRQQMSELLRRSIQLI